MRNEPAAHSLAGPVQPENPLNIAKIADASVPGAPRHHRRTRGACDASRNAAHGRIGRLAKEPLPAAGIPRRASDAGLIDAECQAH